MNRINTPTTDGQSKVEQKTTSTNISVRDVCNKTGESHALRDKKLDSQAVMRIEATGTCAHRLRRPILAKLPIRPQVILLKVVKPYLGPSQPV